MDEGSSRFTARPRVLVVDDEELVRLVVARTLRLSGFDVFEARDGLEPWHGCRWRRPIWC